MAEPQVNGAPPGRADYDRRYQPQAVRRWTSQSFGALEPGKLNTILKSAQTGLLEDWVDLCSYMVRTDPHLRSVLVSRIAAVAGAEVVVEPGKPGQGQTIAQAEAAAEFVRDQIAEQDDWEDRLSDLLYGGFVNVAVLETRWKPDVDRVGSCFGFVHPRDVRVSGNWEWEVRTYPRDASGNAGTERWIRVADHPGKFVVNAPHNFAERPTLTGELMAVAWPWLFKRWTEKFGLEGFQRLANGFLIGKVQRGATGTVRQDLLEGLENLAADGVAVLESDNGVTPIELLEAAHDPGKAGFELVKHWNGEISKALLGSGLNVEVGSTGGNRALGESQFSTTTLPRLVADGKRAMGALAQGWVPWLLQYNAHLFGGMPPLPRLSLTLVKENEATAPLVGITTLALQAGVMKRDELRSAAGLEPLGPDQGGDEFVELAPAQPAFRRAEDATELSTTDDDGRPHIEHMPGGEWAVVLADGTLVDVYATKADAIERLRAVIADPPGGAVAVAPLARSPKRRVKRPPPRQLSLTATPTSGPSGTSPLRRALSSRSDDPARSR